MRWKETHLHRVRGIAYVDDVYASARSAFGLARRRPRVQICISIEVTDVRYSILSIRELKLGYEIDVLAPGLIASETAARMTRYPLRIENLLEV
jgi:hypothetical protein